MQREDHMKLWGVHCELGAQCLEGTRCVLVEGKEEILIEIVIP